MSGPLLILDVSYLAYKVLYAIPGLSHDGELTGVCFGVLNSLKKLQNVHLADRVAFAFDRGHDWRTAISSAYKASRHSNETPEQREQCREMTKQIYRLRTKYLPMAGYRNLFWEDGMEADDIIASVCQSYPKEEIVIVSSDHDLFQCLSPNVSMWFRDKLYTVEMFHQEFGIAASQWALVKAIAGCGGDEVAGVHGVGEKTAALFVSGGLKPGKKFQAIVDNNNLIQRNLKLVTLPFPGTPEFELQEDEVTDESLNRVYEALGIKSLRGRRSATLSN